MNTNSLLSKIQLNANTLKWIAVITMFIDHMAASMIRNGLYLEHHGVVAIRMFDPDMQKLFHDSYYVMRGIGRLAFPVFCFFIVEGFLKTRDVRKYALRTLLFGFLSEIPFDLAIKDVWWFPGHQNVMFTMFIGLLVLMGIRQAWDGDLYSITWKEVIGVVLAVGCGCAAAWILKTDYNYKGILLIVVLYLFRDRKDVQCLTGAAAIAWEKWAPPAFILLYLYNGERGRQNKYFFYLFYPLHLAGLYVLTHWGIPWYLGIS